MGLNFCLICCVGVVLGILACTSGARANAQEFGLNSNKSWGRQHELCPETQVNICGNSFRIPSGYFGDTRSVRMPPQFVTRDVTLQCVGRDGFFAYVVTNPVNPPCTLRQCEASSVRLCDDDIQLDGALTFGQKRKINVPSAHLVVAKRGINREFTVQCRAQGDNVGLDVVDTSGISCNDFPCKPVTLSLCGGAVKVDMKETADLGQVSRVLTRQGQNVAVQCLGTVGYRPAYQITDASQVVCQ